MFIAVWAGKQIEPRRGDVSLRWSSIVHGNTASINISPRWGSPRPITSRARLTWTLSRQTRTGVATRGHPGRFEGVLQPDLLARVFIRGSPAGAFLS